MQFGKETLIQSARLTWKYDEAVFHHTIALNVCTNFGIKLLHWFRIRSGQKLAYRCLRCVIMRDQLPVQLAYIEEKQKVSCSTG